MGQILKNISYSFMANVVSLSVSVCMVMLVPKFLSIDDYGLWQLFLFYFSYLGFMHLGWEDGIYLRYAGKNFADLDRRIFAGQFYAIVLLQCLMAVLVASGGWFLVKEQHIQIALMCAVVLAPVVNFNNLCNFVMQMTNRIKDYAVLILVERLVLLLLVVIVLVTGFAYYKYFFIAKCCSLLAVAFCGARICRSLLFPSFTPLRDILREAIENIRVGLKLMFANIASMLMIGTIRYGISIGWDVAVFGRISLTLGMSNFLMIFISSISVVFFPIVKRMKEEQRSFIYMQIRFALTFILLGLLLCYYPAKFFLSWWLPQYEDSLIYMSVLFPICLFESKVDLLINTYLKSMRREDLMLKLNLIAVSLSAVTTFITVNLLHNLNAVVLAIPLIYASRCVLAELAVGKLLGLDLRLQVFEDIVMTAVFMISGWYMDSWFSTAVYGVAYIGYVIVHKDSICKLRGLVRK